MNQVEVSFILNGKPVSVRVHPLERLLDVIRNQCGLTGTKEGCGEGECGACSVLLNGEPVMSCMMPAVQVEGASVETIEGITARNPDGVHQVQEALIQMGGAQCGICTPGMVVAAVAYLNKPDTAPGGVAEALEGNLCRCTGYHRIFASVEEARKGKESE